MRDFEPDLTSKEALAAQFRERFIPNGVSVYPKSTSRVDLTEQEVERLDSIHAPVEGRLPSGVVERFTHGDEPVYRFTSPFGRIEGYVK